MATFTDEDKRILDLLWKAHQGVVDTRQSLTPWQEALHRDDSVYAVKSVLAAQIIDGFAGSWAASYSASFGGSVQAPGSSPDPFEGADPKTPSPNSQWQESRLGKRGAPELNFVPFNAYTNAQGPKGGALVGHPISFEIVGPTLKSPFCDWTWRVTQGAGAFGGDLLEMDVSYSGGATTSTTILEAYNVPDFTIGGLTEPNGGLYLVITEDGTAPGSMPAGNPPLTPLPNYLDTARTEIFRIVSARLNQFEIHPNKPLSRYFQLPPAGVRYIRAVMVMAPYATRLAAIPTGKPGQSTTGKGGREQVFTIVLPERAASSDLFPPYDGPGAGLGPWLVGSFTQDTAPGSSGAVGEPALWGGKVPLPIPTPRGVSSGTVEKGLLTLPTVNVGLWKIRVTDISPFTAGSTIVKVFQTNRDADIQDPTYGRMGSCLGYFMVYDVLPAPAFEVILGRVPEIFMDTMKIYYGPGPYIQSAAATQNITLSMILYDPVSSMWQGSFDFDKVQSSRVRPIIDPKWGERFSKQLSNTFVFPPVPGSSRGRPDKAIFDTTEGPGAPIPQSADPGNLQDLGFRMVLFPSRPNALGEAIPDFRRPICTREVVIDPALDEPQHIDIDYATGIVTLSHPPPDLANIAIGEGDIIPNGISGLLTNNPRGEVVLFASCVPYSMEPGQTGTGVRLRRKTSDSGPAEDVYHTTIHANVDMVFTAWDPVPPYIGISPLTLLPDLILNQIWQGPQTGTIEILSGSLGSPSYGIWSYNAIDTVITIQGGLVSVLRGLSCLSSATDPSFVNPGDIRTVVLRRNVTFADRSLAPTASLPGGRWYTDTSFGGSKKTSEVILEGASVETTPDGVPIVKIEPSQYLDRAWGQIIPSKLPVGIGYPLNPNPNGSYFAEEGLLAGLAYEVPIGHPNGPEPGGVFAAFTEGGAKLEFRADLVVPSWHGVISRTTSLVPSGVVSMGDDWRYMAKFSIEYDLPGQFANFFLGFAQFQGIPPTFPSVDLFTSGPGTLPFDYSVFAVWHQGLTDPALTIWSRVSGLSDVITPIGNVTVDAATNLTYGPFTVIMECVRVPRQTFVSTTSLRTFLYDESGNLLGSTNHTNTEACPSGGPGLIFCQGVRLTGGSPSARLNMFGSSLLTFKSKPMVRP